MGTGLLRIQASIRARRGGPDLAGNSGETRSESSIAEAGGPDLPSRCSRRPTRHPMPTPASALRGLVLLWFLIPLCLGTPALHAGADAPPNPGNGASTLTFEVVAQRRAEVKKELAAARAALARLPEGKAQEAGLWLTQETALLERIDGVLAEAARTLQHAADLAGEAAVVSGRTKNRRPADEVLKPPYNLALLDQVYAERDYLEEADVTLTTDIGNATDALQEARDTLEDRDRDRRSAREALATARDPVRAQRQLRIAELESRLAQETVQLRETALHTLRFQQSLIEPKRALLRPNLEWLRSHVVITDEDVAADRAAREKRRAEIEAGLEQLRADAEQVSLQVLDLETRPGANPSQEELASRRADRQLATRGVAVLSGQRDYLQERDKVAELRRNVLAGRAAKSDMRVWDAENRTRIERIERDRLLQRAELTKTRRELQDLQARITSAGTENGAIGAWVTERIRRLTAWHTLNSAERAEMQALRSERLRLKEELAMQVGGINFSEAVELARRSVVAAWNYEVFSVQDEPVRVKTILAVIVIVLAGHWLCRRLSELIAAIVFRRLGMATGRRAAWQTLSFYALFLIVILAAFSLFHLSLTQFSVVSGALAVGLGFGSQNLLSNFISGVILLVERPVSKGDVIELDGQQVTVEKLGPRSTIVRSRDNTHVIVPNSRLLEQAVTNWTLTDDIVRRKIAVGVAYGSPTRQVDKILREVLSGVEKVCKKPAPNVTFVDFGPDALVFEALFYCEVDDRVEVETELRHRINEAFVRAGIVMAFPQRDMHLDTSRPLQIEVLSGDRRPRSESRS